MVRYIRVHHLSSVKLRKSGKAQSIPLHVGLGVRKQEGHIFETELWSMVRPRHKRRESNEKKKTISNTKRLNFDIHTEMCFCFMKLSTFCVGMEFYIFVTSK